jgi:isoquinoline 1-oxidoreductase beta subunit
MPYAIPAVAVEHVEFASAVRVGFWRGVQHNHNVFAVEGFIDELAAAAGQDPCLYRLGLLDPGGSFPGGRNAAPTDRACLARVLRLAAEKAGWGKELPSGGARGVACFVYDGGTCVAVIAEVRIDPGSDWRVERIVCGVDCGVAVNPLGIRAQVESAAVWAISAVSSEITLSAGRVEQSSYRDFPVLRMRATPRIETHIVPSERPPSGMGEPPAPATLAAVVNALSAATGRRLRRIPVKPRDMKVF